MCMYIVCPICIVCYCATPAKVFESHFKILEGPIFLTNVFTVEVGSFNALRKADFLSVASH